MDLAEICSFRGRAVHGPKPTQRLKLALIAGFALVAGLTAAAAGETPLVTGNGFGYGVVDPDTAELTSFYAHPYRYMAPRGDDPTVEGIGTRSLVDAAGWDQDVTDIRYLDQSHIVAAETVDGFGQYVFSPFTLRRNVLVLATTAPADRACLTVEWAHPLSARLPLPPTMSGGDAAEAAPTVYAFEGAPERVVAVPLGEAAGERPDCRFAGSAWAFAVADGSEDAAAIAEDLRAWAAGRAVPRLVADEAKAFEKWRKPPPVCFADALERRTWRQSETVLRMAQIRERKGHSHGLINASLPDGDWFMPWTRDMAYAIVAFIKAGHTAEARAALDGLLNARPVGKLSDEAGGLDYQVSTVRYFGDGSEENDHSGNAEPNLEFDSWGLALWAMGEYVRATGDRAWLDHATYRGRVYDTIRDFVVRPLLANLEPYDQGLIVAADSSVWEQNDAPRLHYAASTIAAIAGLQRFADIARVAGDAAGEREVRDKIVLLRTGMRQAFVRDGHLVGTLEPSPRNEVDGAVLEAMNFGLLENERVSDATLARMARLKVRSGGFRRVTGSTNYERQEFLFVNFNVARALLRRGKLAEAETIVHRMRVSAGADDHVFPEMYLSEPDPDAGPDSDYAGEIGRPIGARPMVGYGAGAYLLYLTERQELAGPACPRE